MAERKIHNYKSEILVEETLKEFGYLPDKFGKTSGKFVIATCRFCGKPSKIRKGFFNKAGSACHKECRFKEQSLSGSPFKDEKVKEKTKQTNLARYGVEHASQNKDIAKKISDSKLTEESQEKGKKTNQEKYGVDNPFQSEVIKKKIRETNLEKYGTVSAMQSDVIKEKTRKTNFERYGVDNPLKSPEIREKRKRTNLFKYGSEHPMQNDNIRQTALQSFTKTVIDNNDHRYDMINILRSEEFWTELKRQDKTLKQICDLYGLDYQSLTARLVSSEFKDKYYSVYHFPNQQRQKEVADFIRFLGIDSVGNTRKIISPLELDIYVPSHNFAIEFNGSYWHSEAVLDPRTAKQKHINKTQLCREKGIRLLHIFEHNWLNRKEQYLNFIRTILGKNENRISARKCVLTHDPCRDFIEANHLQGAPSNVTKYFNLVYEGKIVATMTAGHHHRQNVSGNPVVLSRLCFLANTTVQGGATKLFKYFKEWAVSDGRDRILSWSDNGWTEGSVYNRLGFKLDREYGPDYFYWDSNTNSYVSKQSQRKAATGCPKEITERDWCMDNGLFRIHDAGKKLWCFNLDTHNNERS